MLFQFDHQDQLRNKDHKKIINLNKIFSNVFTDYIPILNNVGKTDGRQSWKTALNVFLRMCLTDIIFLVEDIVLLQTFSSEICSDSSVSEKISRRTFN